MTYMINTTYKQQQVVQKYMNDFVSSPKAFQVDPSTVVSNGPLEVKYVIYPDGQVKNLSQPLDGMTDLSSLLNGDPWAYVILSNGQIFNISQPQSSTNSNISLLYLESQVPYYADYPLNVWNVSTYQQIMTKGLEMNPAHWPSPRYINNSWMEYGYGDIVVIPVQNVNGWLNFTASIPAWWNYGVGILFLNESGINEPENNETWMAIILGFTNYTFQYNVTPLYSSNYLPYSFQNSTLPKSNYYTLRVAIHFQEGQPAELYVWWLNGTKWVPIWLKTYKMSTTSDNLLVTTSFPAYLYTGFLTPMTLAPGSNIMIVPDSYGTLVYNITTTI